MIKMNMFKKLLLSFLASTILLVSVLPLFSPTYAQTWYKQPYKDWSGKVFDKNNADEIFGERYTYAQVEWVIYSLVAFLVNNLGDTELNNCLMRSDAPFDPGKKGNCVGDITRVIGKLISDSGSKSPEKNWYAVFTDRPISSLAYFKDIAQRLRIVPEAKAQGFGFGAASVVLSLWKMVRNVTYFLLILVLVVMAFMIMFRVRISPQTVISVQSALPKVIIALLLITFSYAIAGFMIDLMYVVIGLLASIITGSELSTTRDWGEMYRLLTIDNNWFLLMSKYFLAFTIVILPALLGAGVVAVSLSFLTAGASAIIALVILLVVYILLLILGLKILWLLIKTYVNIILLIVFGPIQILLGTLGFGGFGSWLRNLAAQLAVYPTVGFMFILSFVFLRATITWPAIGPIVDELFPFGISNVFNTASWDPPLTVGSSSDLLYLGASVAVLALIPHVADIIRSMLSRKPFDYGTAIGQSLGPATALAGLGVATGVPAAATWLTTPPPPGQRSRIREYVTQRDWLSRGIQSVGDTIARRAR